MVWNSTFPLGSVSVKANRVIGQQNTTYTEVTMGNSIVGTNTTSTRDHFWNVGANEDGRHRFVQSPAFTVGAVATDPVIGSGMDGVSYLKTISGTVQQFYRNAQGIYQTSPTVLRGTVAVTSTSTYVTVVAVPNNTYGEILMYASTQNENTAQTGYFVSRLSLVEAWSLIQKEQSDATTEHSTALKFGNGTQASGLNIRARRESGPSDTWTYIVTYRTM